MSPTVLSVTTATQTAALSVPFRTAKRETHHLDVVRVTITDTAGRTGFGEVTANPLVTGETTETARAVLEGPIADALCGASVDDRRALGELVDRSCVGHPSVKAAAHTAALALALGPDGDRSVLGTAQRAVRTAVTVSLESPEQMAAATTHRVRDGFTVIKLKLGGPVDDDIARLRAVLAADTADVRPRFWLDANQAWTPTETLAVLAAWDTLSGGSPLEWVEQPTPAASMAGLGFVAARTCHPVLADECVATLADVLRAAEHGASGVNIKIAKAGGLHHACAQANTAAAAGIAAVVGCMMESAAAIAPAVALAEWMAPDRTHDLDAAWWLTNPGPLTYTDGTVRTGSTAP